MLKGVGNVVGLRGDESNDKESEINKVNLCDEVKYHPVSGKPIAGSTMSSRKRAVHCMDDKSLDSTETEHIWGDGDSSLFNLRVGPNYAKTGAKAPSAAPFYDIVGIDLYQSENRIVNVGNQVHIPDEWKDIETNHPNVPPVFIIACQMPDVSHALSGITNFFVDKSEGPGTTVLMYFKIKQDTADKLKAGLDTCSPGLKLFVDFCKQGHESKLEYKDPKHPYSGRFKVCPLVRNIDELGLPGFISMYNAKPALIVLCADLFTGDNYIGIDTNIHAFGGLARSAMQVISFDSMLLNWGFAIESREDEEMPEVLFGTCSLDKPNMQMGTNGGLPNWEATLARTKKT